MSNLLKDEESPYLLQHKDNPLYWYPWSQDAFTKAKEQNKLLFISIGYSTCHWCHVMEHEVFEDEQIAAFMNEHFISIKVDKEERPDIDKHYQEIYEALNGKVGGWPTSIFATPDNKPFFAATYIPPKPKYNIVGFTHLTSLIVEKFAKKDMAIFESANALEVILQTKKERSKGETLSLNIKEKFLQECKNSFEPSYGGFTLAPKFPQVATLNTMLSIYELDRDERVKSMLISTLDGMTSGGFYDLVDGGFCRYSVDSEWMVPHFEKMSYDNGLLCRLYLRASEIFSYKPYYEIAKETADFMQKFMMQDFSIYSASDADSDSFEGEYFLYTKAEVLKAIKNAGFSDEKSRRMTMRLMVSNSGNFEGKNILHFANTFKEEWFETIKPELQKLRQKRAYPFRDKRMQTSWSSMVIEAFFALGVREEKYKVLAENSLNCLLEKMYKNKNLMHSSLIEKEAKIEAYLEDYAYLSKTLLYAYEVSADEKYLQSAKSLADDALANYYRDGAWYFSVGEFQTQAESQDNSYPSSIAIMLDSLLSLGTILDEKYREIAYASLKYYALEVDKNRIMHSSMSEQIIRYIQEDRVLKAPFQTNFEKIKKQYTYPFFHVKYHKEHYFELCSNSACFSKSDTLPIKQM